MQPTSMDVHLESTRLNPEVRTLASIDQEKEATSEETDNHVNKTISINTNKSLLLS